MRKKGKTNQIILAYSPMTDANFLIMLITPYTQAKILAFVPHPPDIWTENNNTTLGIGANLEWEAGDDAFNSSFNA